MSDVAAAETTGERPRQASPARQAAGRRPPGRRPRRRPPEPDRRRLEPLIWLGPALILIGVVVLWPVVTLIQTSTAEHHARSA